MNMMKSNNDANSNFRFKIFYFANCTNRYGKHINVHNFICLVHMIKFKMKTHDILPVG